MCRHPENAQRKSASRETFSCLQAFPMIEAAKIGCPFVILPLALGICCLGSFRQIESAAWIRATIPLEGIGAMRAITDRQEWLPRAFLILCEHLRCHLSCSCFGRAIIGLKGLVKG